MATILTLAPETISYFLLLGSDTVDVQTPSAYNAKDSCRAIRSHGREPKSLAKMARLVCWQWNAIVLASPSLWIISIDYNVPLDPDPDDNGLQMCNSKYDQWTKSSLTTDIDVGFRIFCRQHEGEAFAELIGIPLIQRILPRIRILSLFSY